MSYFYDMKKHKILFFVLKYYVVSWKYAFMLIEKMLEVKH